MPVAATLLQPALHPAAPAQCAPDAVPAAAGAPAANKTYFCDAGTSTCFSLLAAPLPYNDHKSYCGSTLNGALVAYGSRDKQLLVRCSSLRWA
jgi:hypothetical protein